MNFGTTRISGWLVYGTAVAALLLTLVPLPTCWQSSGRRCWS